MNLRKYTIMIAPVIALIVIGWGFNSSSSMSSNPEQEQMFQLANQSYQDQEYEKAITQYQNLLNESAQGAHIHNNLASAYQQIGDVGRSIAHYEKAIQLDYYDTDIRSNLGEVRKASAHQVTTLSFWQKITHVLSIKHWVVLASLACLILTVLLLLQLMKRIQLPLKFQLTVAFLTVSFIVFSIFSVRSQQSRIENKAIVLNNDTSLRISPFSDADELIALRPGELVTVDSMTEHEGYIQIELDSGKRGWLKTNEIEAIDVREISNES